MKNRISVLYIILCVVSLLNLAAAVVINHGTTKTGKAIAYTMKKTERENRLLYRQDSLTEAASLLEKKLAVMQKDKNREDPLAVTGRVLSMLERHNLAAKNYGLSGTILTVKTEGNSGKIAELIYDISCTFPPGKGSTLTFMSIETGNSKGELTLSAELSCE